MILSKRRPGFTLLELMTVMIIIGLLAAIAISRFWSVKERAYRASVKNDLRTAAIQQERYFDKNMAYASNASDLPDFSDSPGVTITITWAANSGWAGTALHTSMPGQFCGYFMGPAPAGAAAPATSPGEIKCNE